MESPPDASPGRQLDISQVSPWPGPPVGPLLNIARDVVPVIGAGISAGAGLPTGAGLASWIRRHPVAAGVDFRSLRGPDLLNPRHVSQLVVDENPQNRNLLIEAVAGHIRTAAARAPGSAALQHLAAVPSGLIVTLNYDDLVERAARAAGRQVVLLGLYEAMQFVAEGGPQDNVLRVIHVHGDTEAVSGPLVLDERGYSARLTDTSFQNLLSALVYKHTLLFLGTSLHEPHFLSALSVLRAQAPRHVFVCEQKDSPMATGGTGSSPLTPSQNLQVCCYPDGDHAVLDGFLAHLVSQAAPEADWPQAPPQREDPLYTDRMLLRTDRHNVSTFDQADVLSETELRTRPRAVVVGQAGAGKTHLLQHLTASVNDGDDLLALIRLRKVSDFVGTTTHLLQAWLDQAEVCLGVSAEAVVDGSRPLHLLLDGLDELVPRRREIAVASIRRIAHELPHVRITVTSRPAAALSLFQEPWQRFELVCDRTWQDAFLAGAGTSLDALRERLGQATSTLEPLLSIPFYLRRLAEASDEAIAAALLTGDAAGIVLALLDDLLANDETLRAVAPVVRPWLAKCAMLMQLTGTRQLGLPALERLAADLELGDVEELAQRLSARSLLQDSADTWAFEHRLLSDVLVAHSLSIEDPWEWIDVLAPCAEGRSALREDWREVAAFLCESHSSWREAIGSRDPVMGARFTPTDAPLAERRQAVDILWAQATERQVWLGGGLSSADDGAIIGKLMPRPAPSDFVAAIQERLTSGSRYERANAMDVLVRLEPEGAARRLRTSLQFEPDSTIRRNSATWVRRLQLTELLDLVIERAKHFADDAEAGDMASIALRLTPPSRRQDLGAELLVAGNQGVHEHHVLEGASPMGCVRWWLTVARSKPDEAEYRGTRKLAEILDQIEKPTHADVADVAELATHLGTPTEPRIGRWLANHARGAATGIVRALRDGDAFEPYAFWLGLAIGSAALRSAGAPASIIEWVESQEKAPATPAPAERAQRVAAEPSTRALTIEAALLLPDQEAIEALLNDEPTLLAELENNPGHHNNDALLALIDRAWGNQDIRDGITLADNQARIAPWALLVLAYGPPTLMPLDDFRWEQVALCGWLYSAQHEWLRTLSTAMRRSSATSAAPSDLRVLADLLDITPPGAQPDDLFERIASLPAEQWAKDHGASLLQNLARAEALDSLRIIATRSIELGARVAPLLARAGDVDAQRSALEALGQRIVNGERPREHDYPFLEAVEADTLLPKVLDLFVLAGSTPHEYDPFDITNALVATIERIGGIAAIDALTAIASEPRWQGAQWHYTTVDGMVQRLLAPQSRAAAERMLSRLGLPVTQRDGAP